MAYVTYRDIRRAFAQLCKASGFTLAESPTHVGAYQLDRNGGGWMVERIENEAGAVSHPFGSDRYASAPFIRMLFFAADVAQRATPEVKVVVVQDPDDEVSEVYVYRGRWSTDVCLQDARDDLIAGTLRDEPVVEDDRENAEAFVDEFMIFTCKEAKLEDI